MDSLLTETKLSYGGPAPILLAASSEPAFQRATATADSLGLRIAARLPIAQARERLKQQASASAIWIEVDRDCGDQLEALLDEVDKQVASRRFGAVLSITSDVIDSFGARLFDGDTQVVVDASPVERLASLATATAVATAPERANDVSKDQGAERLRQLSDEVNRIAATLARLSIEPAAAGAELRMRWKATSPTSPWKPSAR